MVTFDQVRELIQGHIQDAQVKVHDLTGTQDHLGIMVISDQFEGKILIDQHQMIMDILKEKLGTNEIHAVQLKTLTYSKARKKGVIE